MMPGARLRHVVDVGLALFIATLLAIEALRAFLASVYAMNVLTVGLNASVVAVLFLLAPAAYPLGLARANPRLLTVLFAFLFLTFRIFLIVPWSVEILSVLGGVTVALYFLFLVPYVATLLRLAGGAATVATSFGLAFAADIALRAIGNSLDPGATPWTIFYLVPLGVVFLWSVVRVELPGEAPSPRPTKAPASTAGLGIGAFLALGTLVLQYPDFLARWLQRDPASLTAALVLGFCVGAYVAKAGLGVARRSALWSGVLQVLLVVFVFDVGLGGSVFSLFLAFLAALASVVGLERILGWFAMPGPSLRSVGNAFTLASVVFLLSLIAFVFSLTYAYVPASALWRNHEPAILVLIALGLVVPAFVAGGRSPSAASTRTSMRWVAITAAVILLLASLGIVITVPVAVPAPSSGSIRVMTYNVHQGFSADGRLNVDRIAEMVRFANPDILALEESDSVRVTSGGVDVVGYLASTLGYYVAYGPPTRVQTYGVSILSRYPIASWDYDLLPSPGDQRVLVRAILRLPNTDLQVFAIHLGLDGTERDAQIAEVLRVTSLSTGLRILMGDFNACPSGLCPESGATTDHVYADVNASWSDAWVEANGASPVPWSYTYGSLNPFERIDYVFVSPGIDVHACSVLGNIPTNQSSFLPLPSDASDHLPVVADVALG